MSGNPMRWKCFNEDGSECDGCFNEKRRPKIEVFGECFPRNINFGDVDGQLEIGGNFLLLEWKGNDSRGLKAGQSRALKAYSALAPHNCCAVVCGDAQSMEVSKFGFFYAGKWHDYRAKSLAGVKAFFKKWAEEADK